MIAGNITNIEKNDRRNISTFGHTCDYWDKQITTVDQYGIALPYDEIASIGLYADSNYKLLESFHMKMNQEINMEVFDLGRYKILVENNDSLCVEHWRHEHLPQDPGTEWYACSHIWCYYWTWSTERSWHWSYGYLDKSWSVETFRGIIRPCAEIY